MTTIYKYVLNDNLKQTLSLPIGAKILTVQTQYNKAVLWAVVNPEQTRKQERIFKIRPTGHIFEDGSKDKYIGTFQLDNGDFVGHLYEEQ